MASVKERLEKLRREQGGGVRSGGADPDVGTSGSSAKRGSAAERLRALR
jgi:hypothetical protein